MSFQINLAQVFIHLLLTAFAYLLIPLIICGIVYKVKKHVRYSKIIFANTAVMFAIFSSVDYFGLSIIANVISAIFWPIVSTLLSYMFFKDEPTACPECGKQTTGNFCTYCGAKIINEESVSDSE